ncbi:MAG: hypothetical protein HY658_03960 [Actinobacteria bacterium]|nr:hypothetical protein [Actinomycetota bacterium]
MDWELVLRQAVAPVLAAYLVVLGSLVATARARRRPGPPPGRLTGRVLARRVLATVAGGFGFFLLIIVVFYFVLGGEDPTLVADALLGGSVLALGIVLPAFLVLTVAEGWLRRRRAPDP